MPESRQVQKVYETVKSAVFGHAVGDALGVPLEFVGRERLAAHPVTDMRAFGTHNLPRGSWSDDTSMTLCTLASLTERGAVVPEDMMLRFSQWANNGAYTPFGRAFGIGRTTFQAIADYLHGKPYGGAGERDNGNGSLMRILPVPLYQHFCPRKDAGPEERIREVHAVSALTHAHRRSMEACGIYAFIMESLLEEQTSPAIRRGLQNADRFYRTDPEHAAFSRLFSPGFAETPADQIRSSGYVADTLEAAVWCLLTTGSYRACVLRAVNLGGDTDTVAAVAGGLAGVLYGFDAIPPDWSSALIRRGRLDDMCMAAARSWTEPPEAQ